MKKLLLLLLLCSCQKEPQWKCISCQEIKKPDTYIPTYCADIEAADQYMNYMNKQVKYKVPVYKCQEKPR